MDRVPVAVAVGPWVVEGMSENETFTDEMLVHHRHHHLYHSEEAQVHEEKSRIVREIEVIPSPAAEATLVHHRGLAATLPSRTDRGRVHEIPTPDHPTAEVAPLDQSHGAIPVRHRVSLPNVSVVLLALAITVMTKKEGRDIDALGPRRLTPPLSRNWHQ